MEATELERIVKDGAEYQRKIDQIPAWIAIVGGAGISLLAIFVPAKPGEEAVKGIMTVLAIGSLVGGVWYSRRANRRCAAFVELVLRAKAQIRDRTLVQVRRRGSSFYQVGLKDASGASYRVTMPSEAAARAVLESTRA